MPFDLDLQVQGETLTIQAAGLSRQIYVPAGVTPGRVRATCLNGLLEVRVPKP